MHLKVLGVTALFSLAVGCTINFDADVPCEIDGDCPKGYTCDLTFFRCVDRGDRGDDTTDDVTEDTTDVLEDTDPGRDITSDTVQDGSGEDTGSDTTLDTTPDGSGDTSLDTTPDTGDTSDDTGGCIPTGAEVCDGADNDCNGTIDDGGVCDGPCPGGMVQVDLGDGSPFCIDSFEASRRDATATSPGTDSSVATSRAGVIPWSAVAFADANAACTAAGKRLCTAFEWQTACQGPALNLYPYGNAYQSTACNGSNSPPLDGPAPAGSFAACVSSYETRDQSGNLAEFTTDGILRGGAFADPQLNLRCSSRLTDAGGDPLPAYGFRCCSDSE